MIDLCEPIFKTAQVASACNVPASTFRMHFTRDNFRVVGAMDARMADAAGMPNLFSARDAIGFAVACRLIEVSRIDPKRAFDIAVFQFAHTGCHERAPATVYDSHEHGETLLFYWPDSDRARLVKESDITGASWLYGGSNGDEAAAVVIRLNPLLAGVYASLGFDPQEAMKGHRIGDTATTREATE